MDVADWMVSRLVSFVRPGDTIVVGVATPLALAAAMVARELVDDVVVLVGGAVDPDPHDIAETIHDPASLPGRSSGVLGQRALLQHVQRGDVDVQFVSPAQVDGLGRFNTVMVEGGGGGRWLAGPLALPDTAAHVDRVVAYRSFHGPRFLVEDVDHVTGPGLAGVVTSVADIRFGDDTPVVVAAVADFATVASGCSFDLVDRITRTPQSDHFVAALEVMDPGRVRDLEVVKR
jgi:acyl CoA:acetate/3-ketoacid CoA transferase beta subunit